MTDLIKKINNALQNIKKSAGIDPNSDLEELNRKINDLKSAAISNQQQIVLLYTYAENDDAAENKSKPTFEWTDNGAKIIDLPDNGWIPSRPDITDSSESLYIRFVSVAKDKSTDYGIPIKLTGEKGDKGEKGSDGINAVALGASTIVKLYNRNEPDKDLTFKFDTDKYRQNGKILENIKYNDICIDSDESDWTSKIPAETFAYEVTIKVTVDNTNIDILAGPICIVPEIQFVKNQYKLSTSNTECDEDVTWSDEYQYVKVDAPYLWSRIYTKYANGCESYSKPFLLNEMQKFIIGIDVTYGASNSVSTVPTEWSKEVPKGIVIWKKEITTFSDETENTVICPMSIQGEPGIQYVGKFKSKEELSGITVEYNKEFIGKIGVIINGETYVWYGSETNTLSECEQIGDSWWLNLGNTSGLMTEILYDDLVKLRDSGELIPGMQYRIIDYETTSTAYDTSVAGHFFDIIVTANSNSCLSEKARADHSKRDEEGYFNSSNISAWEIWYDINNDVNRFDWADGDYGKGVIYRMIDEFGNDCPYDFKNILYSIGTSADQYTFSQFVDGECYDSSVARLGEDANAKNNIIVSENGYDSSVRLPFIILTSHQCKNNCFGPNCSSIHIENETYISGYKIGADCSNITSNMADNVIIGDRCNNINIDCNKPGHCNIESDCQNLNIIRDSIKRYAMPYYINILSGTNATNNNLFMVGSPFTATYSFNTDFDGSLRVVQKMINPDCVIYIDDEY